MIKMFCCR